jgi:hypothetical protein
MKRIYRVLGFCVIVSITIYSCTHVSGTYISAHGSRAGSSMKDNCMNCHKTGATYGGFIVAGSVYAPDGNTRYPNATITLFKDSMGLVTNTILGTIEVDGVGNFYTTHPIDLSQGVHPMLSSQNGDTTMMTVTTNGACNSCHGTSIQRNIVVKSNL